MTNIQAFDFGDDNVRSVIIDGQPWLVASDVATLLGYTKPYDAVQRHCKHAKMANLNTTTDRGSTRGNPNVTIINRSDTMRLCCNSNKPDAQKIEAWLFDVVFASIAETGSYIAPGASIPMLGNTSPKVSEAIASLVSAIEGDPACCILAVA